MLKINNSLKSIYKPPIWSYWLLVLLVFASHGMLLLNEGVYWDGWTLYGYYLNHDKESLLEIFREAGSPWMGYFHLAFWSAPNLIFTYKLVSFLGILLSTLLVFLIVQRISLLTALERWFIAAMFCCYSAFQANVDIIITGMRINYLIFIFGIYIALRSFESHKRASLILRISALVLIFISFTTPSLLVLYFPLLAAFLLGRQQEWQGKNLRGKMIALSRYGDFIVLPFVQWILRRMFSKPTGDYVGYNSLIFDPMQWINNFWQSIENSILVQFQNGLILFENRPWLGAFIFLCVITMERIYSVRQSKKMSAITATAAESMNSLSLKNTMLISLIAALLLISAIFPYVIVGKFLAAEGWDSRHALLISLPMAVGFVSLGRWLHFVLAPRHAYFIARVSAGILILFFTLVTCKTYLEWQVRWIKDSSFIVNLRQLPKIELQDVNKILVNDTYPVGYGIHRFYEYAGMFRLAWGDETRLGIHPSVVINSEWTAKNLPSKKLVLKDFQQGGCQIMVTMRFKHPESSHLKIVTAYQIYRFLHHADLPVYLSEITTLELSNKICPAP